MIEMNVEIKHKITGKVILSGAYESIKDCLDKNRGAYLEDANLEDAYLSSAYLEDANLKGADLRNANLRGAYLRNANLRGADLRNANLIGAYLEGANLRNANLRCADLEGANLIGAYLEGANLKGADLRNANLRGADLEGAGLYIQTETWQVVTTPTHIKIGCQFHTKEEWFMFDDEKIGNMDSKALDWWTKWKPILELMLANKE